MSTKELFYICAAILLRMILFLCGLVEFLETRIEISTPFNSWIRVKEAFALQNAGFSPYSGDAVHCNPILLIMFNFIDHNASWFTPFLFCLFDVIAAFLLSNATYLYRLKKHSVENLQKSQFAPNIKHLLLNENENTKISQLHSCKNNNYDHELSPLLRKTVACIFFLTMLLFVDVYFATLIIPVFLFVSQGGNFDWKKVVYLNLFFFQCLGFFALLSYLCFGDWSFLNSTIGAVLTLSDLTPNFGLYWYYFVEMFDHFRLFFLFEGCFFSYLYTTIDKYFVQILPLNSRLCRCIQPDTLFCSFISLYLILFMWCTCMVLSPVMWYLWIGQGSANANFFFAITLVYLVAQVFLISDFLQAHVKRCFCIRHGEGMLIDGENGVYVLDLPRSKGIRFDCCSPIEPPTMWIDDKKEDNIPGACQSQTASQTLSSTWPSENETLTNGKMNTNIVTTSTNMLEQRRLDFERKRAEHYANEATIARQHFNESFPLNNNLTIKESSKDLQSSSEEDKESKNKQNDEHLPNEAAAKKDKPEDSKEI
ncbi:Phosphatidylinositol glycan anchor biosynthesis class U protein [Trichinella pseudospiralis]|uniref:Phosphatidylinositol glycan anchor biosynthesis class U protein n=1 Tax=Trichinella pseudospiralis TaxID=6337 RepID=A0A0V0YDX7_TRIPS|nr:Phosphatidylinositol glycan anchor biosynthesis class U protein [Trichinella pseudospiralis]